MPWPKPVAPACPLRSAPWLVQGQAPKRGHITCQLLSVTQPCPSQDLHVGTSPLAFSWGLKCSPTDEHQLPLGHVLRAEGTPPVFSPHGRSRARARLCCVLLLSLPAATGSSPRSWLAGARGVLS